MLLPAMLERSDTATQALVFKALGDETRVKIINMLNVRPRAVNEIVDFFSLAQPTISRHLNLLKNSGLVVSKRRGQQVIYSLNEDFIRERALSFFAGLECCKGLSVPASKKK